VITIIMGPQIARCDLRQDLANLAVLKAWPVNGATLVRGEILAPAALLSVITWFSALGAAFTGVAIKPSWIFAAAVLSPGVILLQLLSQNAIAVMWPAWVMTGPNRVRGIDVTGQRILAMFGFLLVLVIAVVPAAVVAALTAYTLYLLTGAVFIVPSAIVAAVALLVEAYGASEVIGRMLDRTDVSAVPAQE
jgi:hypothetical protein